MALTLTGSKRWSKMKVMERFGKQHCGLTSAKIEAIHGEVEQAIIGVAPQLSELASKFSDFSLIAEKIAGLMQKRR